MWQQWNKALIAIIGLCFSVQLMAQPFVKGEHYFDISEKILADDVVKQYRQSRSDKSVIVIEFFSFGCGACAHIEPKMDAFEKKMGSLLHFEQVPVVFHPQWESLARSFYVLEAVPADKVLSLKTAIFDTIHRERRDASQLDVMRVIFERQGIAGDTFDKAYASFGVEQKREFAKTLVRAFKVDEIPMVVVIGPYGAYYTKPSVKDAGTQFVPIIEHMVAKVKQKS